MSSDMDATVRDSPNDTICMRRTTFFLLFGFPSSIIIYYYHFVRGMAIVILKKEILIGLSALCRTNSEFLPTGIGVKILNHRMFEIGFFCHLSYNSMSKTTHYHHECTFNQREGRRCTRKIGYLLTSKQ